MAPPKRIPLSNEWIVEHYVRKKWSIRDIAKHAGCPYGTARRMIIRAGVELRGRGRAPGQSLGKSEAPANRQQQRRKEGGDGE